jgi:DNA-binding response OmpR family regulator
MLDFTVLLIEADPSFRLFMRLALEVLGGIVVEAADTLGGLRAAYESSPDVAIVVFADDGTGLEAVERLRDVSGLPILAVGLVADREAVRRASEAGANVYLARSTHPEGIAERAAALVTRAAPAARRAYSDDRLHVDFEGVGVRADGRPVRLTPLEHRVLECLVRRPGTVVSPEELAAKAWADGAGDPGRVKPHIGGLRRKLGGVGARVTTLRGKGYSYRPFDR